MTNRDSSLKIHPTIHVEINVFYKYIYIYILDRIARQRRASGAPGDPEDPARDPTGPQDDPQDPVFGGGPASLRPRRRQMFRSPGRPLAQYINRLALACQLN